MDLPENNTTAHPQVPVCRAAAPRGPAPPKKAGTCLKRAWSSADGRVTHLRGEGPREVESALAIFPGGIEQRFDQLAQLAAQERLFEHAPRAATVVCGEFCKKNVLQGLVWAGKGERSSLPR